MNLVFYLGGWFWDLLDSLARLTKRAEEKLKFLEEELGFAKRLETIENTLLVLIENSPVIGVNW